MIFPAIIGVKIAPSFTWGDFGDGPGSGYWLSPGLLTEDSPGLRGQSGPHKIDEGRITILVKEVAAMQGTPGNWSGRDDNIGFSLMSFQMSPEFREAVVKRALTWRDRVSTEARDALRRAVNEYITVPGFRPGTSASAPPYTLNTMVTRDVQANDRLAGAVLRVWYESHDELREIAASHLESWRVPVMEPDFSGGEIGVGLNGHPLTEASAAFAADHPETDEDAAILVMELMTGTFLLDAGEEEPGGGQLASVLEDALEALRRLPAEAEAWEEIIPGFSEGVAGIIEGKKSERKLAVSVDNLFAEICEEYGGLTEFFQWNTDRWFVANLLAGVDLGDAHGLAVKLKEMLSEYGPIHERASVASEEMERAEKRMDLMPAILEVGESLDGMIVADDNYGEGPVRHKAAAGDGAILIQEGAGEHNGSPNDAPNQNLSATNTGAAREEAFHEVPPCQIEDYLLMRLEIQELDKENDDLERQVETLKEQLYETRSVGEGLRLALAYKEDGSVEEVEFPILEDVKAAVELATERFRERLLFHCNSESTIEDNPFKWPEQVWKALEWLATGYYDSRIGLATNPDLDVSCREASGMWYKTSQHDNTMALYRNAYTTRVNGRIIWLGEHIGKGTGFDPRRTIRIGFDWDRTLQKVIIGYVGRHQTTSAS